MSKTITNSVRSDDQLAILHLFEFHMDKDLDGTVGEVGEILYFTDHDIFVTDGTNEYTPLAISFDRLVEDFSMASDSINVSIDNINGALTTEALASEWRNNPAKITRIIYTPPSQTLDSVNYDYGLVHYEAATTYPRLDISSVVKDTYVMFDGLIDSFNATSQALNGSLTTQFAHWAKPYPSRTYNQNEFTSIVNAIVDVVYWGRQETV
jgi:hypothetical protein